MIESSNHTVLILLDLDQLSPDIPATTPIVASIGPYTGKNLGAIVCIACNQNKMRRQGFSFDSLRQLASHISVQLGISGDIVCEFAPCLIAPESADRALVRLLKNAPCPSHTGPFGKLILLTRDKGLRKLFHKLIPSSRTRIESLSMPDAIGYRLSKKSYTRGCPSPFNNHVPAEPPTKGWSVPIESPPQAAWASEQLFTMEIDNFQEFSSLLDCKPFLLSQCSTTQTSTRGVSRCVPSLNPLSTFGEVSATDGLVLTHHSSPPPAPLGELAPGSIQEASIGPGAIHLTSKNATYRTNLPVAAIQYAHEKSGQFFLDISGRRVDDTRMLSLLPRQDSFGSLVQVNIMAESLPNGLLLRFKLEYGDEDPSAWWYMEGKSSTYEHVLFETRSRAIPKKVIAQMRRFRSSIVMAVPSDVTEVSLDKEILRGSLGAGRWDSEKVAVLAITQKLQKQKHSVLSIQDCSFSTPVSYPRSWDRNLWTKLQSLPIVIPKCQIPGRQCICTRKE